MGTFLKKPSSTGTLRVNGDTSITSSATITPSGECDTNRLFVSALATGATFAAPTGTLEDGNMLIIRIKGTSAQTLTWNAIYRAGNAPLPSTTIAGKVMYLAFMYHATDVKWDLLSYNDNF